MIITLQTVMKVCLSVPLERAAMNPNSLQNETSNGRYFGLMKKLGQKYPPSKPDYCRWTPPPATYAYARSMSKLMTVLNQPFDSSIYFLWLNLLLSKVAIY